MGVKGLTIAHVKSHLQMYRSMKQEQVVQEAVASKGNIKVRGSPSDYFPQSLLSYNQQKEMGFEKHKSRYFHATALKQAYTSAPGPGKEASCVERIVHEGLNGEVVGKCETKPQSYIIFKGLLTQETTEKQHELEMDQLSNEDAHGDSMLSGLEETSEIVNEEVDSTLSLSLFSRASARETHNDQSSHNQNVSGVLENVEMSPGLNLDLKMLVS
ncbi:uncharacterized protein LOC143846866 isoform X2 [Tasmannia lanceolata]